MSTFSEVLQHYVNLSYDELLITAKKDYNLLLPVFGEVADDGSGEYASIAIICTGVAADGVLSELEMKFLGEIFDGVDEKTLLEAASASCDESSFKFVDDLFDACPAELQSVLLELILCVMSCDETISASETAFVRRLLA